MIRSSFLHIALLISSLAYTGCDQINPPVVDQADSTCKANQAQIRISDGFFENLCGCAEPSGTQVQAPGTLTCTVHAGTIIYFFVVAAFTHHQIVPSGGTLTFPASPVNDTGNTSEIQPFAVPFPNQGTANFTDAYNTSLQGQIVVIP